jgi:UMF1 family MFS transporter
MLIVQPFVAGSVLSFDISFIHGAGKVASFLPTALLFFLFSVPLFLWVKELPIVKPGKVTFRQSYREVWNALRQTRKYPGVLRFLIADYFFEDAAMTVILNIGLYCSIVIGLAEEQITTFLVISTVAAVIGAFMLGKISEYVSLRNLLRMIVIGWIVSLLLFVLYDKPWMVWLLGSLIGILLGGLWTTTRPMLAEMVPREDLGRFFGIFSLSGRAAAVVGPIVWTIIVYFFSPERFLGRTMIDIFSIPPDNYVKLPYKMGVFSLVMLMLIGLYIYRKVPHTRRRTDA